PHPWPSAIRVLSGKYEMGIGFGAGDEAPPVAARVILSAGNEYEMTHPDGWHYVRPINEPSMSLMVTGRPWERPSPKSERPLSPLHPEKVTEIRSFFYTRAKR